MVDKEKVNSLVNKLETMKKEKSDLKMAVYKEFETLGEQLNEILGENSCDPNPSSCLVPVKADVVHNALDSPTNSGSTDEDEKVEAVVSQIAICCKVKQICCNCDTSEVSGTHDNVALCCECTLYQQEYNKPRPSSIHKNCCPKCDAIVWIQGKSNESVYCDGCKVKYLSITPKPSSTAEYIEDEPVINTSDQSLMVRCCSPPPDDIDDWMTTKHEKMGIACQGEQNFDQEEVKPSKKNASVDNPLLQTHSSVQSCDYLKNTEEKPDGEPSRYASSEDRHAFRGGLSSVQCSDKRLKDDCPPPKALKPMIVPRASSEEIVCGSKRSQESLVVQAKPEVCYFKREDRSADLVEASAASSCNKGKDEDTRSASVEHFEICEKKDSVISSKLEKQPRTHYLFDDIDTDQYPEMSDNVTKPE